MQIDLTVQQGAKYQHTFTYVEVGASGVPAPVDLSGVTAKMQIRPHARSNTLLFDSQASNFNIDPATGSVELVIDHTTTAALNFRKAVYAIELTLPNGDVERMVEGAVQLSFEVVRP